MYTGMNSDSELF